MGCRYQKPFSVKSPPLIWLHLLEKSAKKIKNNGIPSHPNYIHLFCQFKLTVCDFFVHFPLPIPSHPNRIHLLCQAPIQTYCLWLIYPFSSASIFFALVGVGLVLQDKIKGKTHKGQCNYKLLITTIPYCLPFDLKVSFLRGPLVTLKFPYE